MYISDVNDENPQFKQNRYELDIPEVYIFIPNEYIFYMQS